MNELVREQSLKTKPSSGDKLGGRVLVMHGQGPEVCSRTTEKIRVNKLKNEVWI